PAKKPAADKAADKATAGKPATGATTAELPAKTVTAAAATTTAEKANSMPLVGILALILVAGGGAFAASRILSRRLTRTGA
ncbi:hypothetical protein, partial [Planobispora takensis]